MGMLKFALIFLGSGIGGVCRYALSGWVQRLGTDSFPMGTLAVNVLGCLLIGLLSASFSGRVLVREEYRVALIVGILGGFTTFSAFGMETFALLNDAQFARAGMNVAASVGAGLTAVWIGYRIAEHWLGA
jgi:CrcB protein